MRQRFKDVTHVCRQVTADIILILPTCGVQPVNLSDHRCTLPSEKAAFANDVLTVLNPNSSDKSDENTVEHRRALLCLSPTTWAVAKAMVIELEALPIAHGLRRAHGHFDFPAAAFAFAACLVSGYSSFTPDLNAKITT